MPVSVELSGDLFATLQDQHGGAARDAVEDAALLYLTLENPEEMIEGVESSDDIAAGRDRDSE